VLERSKESDLTGMMRFNNIRVVDAATVPALALRPNVPASVAVGLRSAWGLALAPPLAAKTWTARSSLRTIWSAKWAFRCSGCCQRSTRAPPTSRPRKRREAKGPKPGEPVELTVFREPTSGIAEAARALRTNIIFMSPDKPQRRLLVTSAGPAEGKTTVACCIAIAMAQAGQRVLLVDCDLRRPRLHRVFGRDNHEGVTNVLLDLDMLDTLAIETEVPNLSMLPSGPNRAEPCRATA